MTEKFYNPEAERIPSELEIMNLIENNVGYKPFREIIRKEDETGLYRLTVEVIGDDGDPVRYAYIRAGKFSGSKSASSQTAIDIIYLNSEGKEISGRRIAQYIDNKWIEE